LGVSDFRTLRPIVTKLGKGDYVGEMSQEVKIQTDRPSGGVSANG